MIEINGLTQYQVSLLDEMWACDSMEDFDEFLEALDPEDRAEAMRLKQMILLAFPTTDYPQLMKHCYCQVPHCQRSMHLVYLP